MSKKEKKRKPENQDFLVLLKVFHFSKEDGDGPAAPSLPNQVERKVIGNVEMLQEEANKMEEQLIHQ